MKTRSKVQPKFQSLENVSTCKWATYKPNDCRRLSMAGNEKGLYAVRGSGFRQLSQCTEVAQRGKVETLFISPHCGKLMLCASVVVKSALQNDAFLILTPAALNFVDQTMFTTDAPRPEPLQFKL